MSCVDITMCTSFLLSSLENIGSHLWTSALTYYPSEEVEDTPNPNSQFTTSLSTSNPQPTTPTPNPQLTNFPPTTNPPYKRPRRIHREVLDYEDD